MLQISNPPAFPQAGTRSQSPALAIVVALVVALVAGAVLVARLHAPHRTAEFTPAPPSYAEALKQAEAEDMAKGVTPEMAAALRAQGTAEIPAKSDPRGQF